jgi:hypothetical protein
MSTADHNIPSIREDDDSRMLSLDMMNLTVDPKSKLKNAVDVCRHTYVRADTHF